MEASEEKMSNNITVSFILPIYNVAAFLGHCLESVLKQSLPDYEVILVNDGSTDASLSICQEYASKYDCIRVIDQLNQGVSVARNTGLKMAKGKYICFLDADDYYIEDFAKSFYEQCEEYELDIIRGLYCIVQEDYRPDNIQSWVRKLSFYNHVLDGGLFLWLSMKEHSNEVVPWLGFFRRDFLLENDITFPPGISFEEDQIFFLKALVGQPCRIMQMPVVFYAYRQRLGSATSRLTIKKAQDVEAIVNSELALARAATSLKVKIAAKRYAGSSFFQITNIYGRVRRKDRRKVIKMCSFRTKLTCTVFAATNHQRLKNAVFTFTPNLLGLAYDLKTCSRGRTDVKST